MEANMEVIVEVLEATSNQLGGNIVACTHRYTSAHGCCDMGQVGPSISHVYAFVGMKGDANDNGLRASNMWSLAVEDRDSYAHNIAPCVAATHPATMLAARRVVAPVWPLPLTENVRITRTYAHAIAP